MDKKEIVFAEGVKVKNPFPDLFSISIKFDDFSNWAFKHKNENGYLNLTICKSREKETWYCKLNDWKPEKKTETESKDEFPF